MFSICFFTHICYFGQKYKGIRNLSDPFTFSTLNCVVDLIVNAETAILPISLHSTTYVEAAYTLKMASFDEDLQSHI